MTLTDVLWAIETRDEIVELGKMGIQPFSEYRRYPRNSIFYDDKSPESDAYGSVRVPVVLDCLVDEFHHDIISTYGKYKDDYSIRVSARYDTELNEWSVEMIAEDYVPGSSLENSIIYDIKSGSYNVCH